MTDLLVCTACIFSLRIPIRPLTRNVIHTHHSKGSCVPWVISKLADLHISVPCVYVTQTHPLIHPRADAVRTRHPTFNMERDVHSHAARFFPVTLTTHVLQSQFTHSLLNTSDFISIIRLVCLELSVACQCVKSVALNIFQSRADYCFVYCKLLVYHLLSGSAVFYVYISSEAFKLMIVSFVVFVSIEFGSNYAYQYEVKLKFHLKKSSKDHPVAEQTWSQWML